ncbi:MAG: hypothetical protein UW86_C0011G0014 [Microgenomates group bacterium GW2011_GWA1_Microgenomates_45_10]|nr:MAG: hypothetical protein UW86_C0011G0014 [Microgenomates group bacterium GW2011_GWA1_Microgenomates_45_10]KKT97401.1 MAG: hypothetical protein UX00_C0011G0013 [Microgenomates group bacterium GW2011_GWB1_45_17]KKU28899.1 MAG: hypothetical protein UX42_C0006G0051 [Microgenomates group bacterium GW2011_GWC1_46_20]
MTETTLGPEAQELLPKAVREVSGLYLGDQLANLLRTQPPEQRDQFWQQTAQEFGPFSEKITGLREAVKSADVTKKAYPEPVGNVMRLHFSGVGDDAARELLTDLLFARTTTSPGYMDYGMEVVEEARAMTTELGVGEGLRGEGMKSVNLDKVVEGVLSGSLKLSRQTQLQNK